MKRFLLGSCAAAAVVWALWVPGAAQGVLTVTGIARNHSSVRFFFNPVSGAADYRLYDITAPSSVKYAGLWHLQADAKCPGSDCTHHFVSGSGPGGAAFPFTIASSSSGGPKALDIPALELDWNTDSNAHTVILQAVDALGPSAQANLYNGDNISANPTPLAGGGMLGSNKGPTPDGKTSTNGQGPYTNTPTVLAQSPQIRVQANTSYAAIPSAGYVEQTFFDTFEDAENNTFAQTFRTDGGSMDIYGNVEKLNYTLNASTAKAWTLEFRRANNDLSMPFIANNHFMDMLFDGGTPSFGSGSTHNNYSSLSMSPVTTFSIAGGKMAHLTMEVDGHQSFRRWMAFDVSTAANPLLGWHPETDPIAATNQALFMETKHGLCTLDVYTGPTPAVTEVAPTGTAGSTHGARLWGLSGASGGGDILCDDTANYVTRNLSVDSRGLDDKNRFDFFFTSSHAALFQDGDLIIESDIPGGSFGWSESTMKAYFSHYLYHSINDQIGLKTDNLNGIVACYALNFFWINHPVNGTSSGDTICGTSAPPGYGMQYSDERHWDNMGFEVIPAANVPSTSGGGWGANIPAAMIALPSTDAPTFSSTTAPVRLRLAGVAADPVSGLASLVLLLLVLWRLHETRLRPRR